MATTRSTLEEIRREYPDEYVVLIDVDVDDDLLVVRSGRVASHSKSRRVAIEQADLPEGAGFALEYTGAPDPAYLLHLKVG